MSPSRIYVAVCDQERKIELKQFYLPDEYENNLRIAHLFFLQKAGKSAEAVFPMEKLGNILPAFTESNENKEKKTLGLAKTIPPSQAAPSKSGTYSKVTTIPLAKASTGLYYPISKKPVRYKTRNGFFSLYYQSLDN